MKIFVINMDNAIQRLAFQQKQMKTLGIEFERIPAIPLDALEKNFINHCKKTWLRKEIRIWEISSYFNNQTIWQKILQANQPALILEDDAVLTDDVPQILKQLENNKTFADYINLESTAELNLIGKQAVPLYKNYNLIRSYIQTVCCAAYILYPKGAQILLEASRKYTGPVDVYINSPLIRMSRWFVELTPAYQNPDFFKQSLEPEEVIVLSNFLKRKYKGLCASIIKRATSLRNLSNAEERVLQMPVKAANAASLRTKMIIESLKSNQLN